MHLIIKYFIILSRRKRPGVQYETSEVKRLKSIALELNEEMKAERKGREDYASSDLSM